MDMVCQSTARPDRLHTPRTSIQPNEAKMNFENDDASFHHVPSFIGKNGMDSYPLASLCDLCLWSCSITTLQRWGRVALQCVLIQWTLFPIFHELATTFHPQSEDLEHLSECLSARSKIVMTVQLAIVALTWAASDDTPSKALAPLIILLWSILNRAYYESLPLAELQVRVQNSNPAIVAFLYAIPELYQVYFIIHEVVVHGDWVSGMLVGIVFGIHAAMRGLAIYRAGRRQSEVIPSYIS